MEFEKNAPVSDEQRRLAETKKITVQPAHAGIAPDDVSDSEIANSHINGQPITNVNNSTGQNTPPAQQVDETHVPDSPEIRKQATTIMLITVGVTGIVITISLFVVFALISS